MKRKHKDIICCICNKQVKYISRHTKNDHNILNFREYYDLYMKTKNEGHCIVCGTVTKFDINNLRYLKCCNKRCSIINAKNTFKHSSNYHNALIDNGNKISKSLKRFFETDKGIINKHKLSKNRMGILNPIHTQTKESKINSSIKHSASIKKRISDGSFTPCITNSWASSRCKIYADGKFYRSTWEAVFHILNPMCEYEKIRIPYISPIDNKEHIYMVDFVNFHDRIIYEIKPNSNIHNKVVEAKTESASGWSASNQYKYVIISNEWFMQNAPKIDYTLYDPKIKTGMKQFLHENKKH